MSCSGFNAALRLLLSIIIFTTLPIILTLSIPLILLRLLIVHLAPLFRPDLAKIVNTWGSVFAAEDKYNKPQCNVIFTLSFDGNIDIQKAKEIIDRTLIEGQSVTTGELKYPELKQSQTYWLGYCFWRDDPNFHLGDHVYEYKPVGLGSVPVLDEDIKSLREKLLKKEWLKDKPLWEMVFVPNCRPKWLENDKCPATTMLIRFHHSVGDGYSWIRLFVASMCESSYIRPKAEYFRMNRCSKIVFYISLPFRTSYRGATEILRMGSKSPLKVPLGKQVDRIDVCDRISMEKIREIKNHFKVSFSSVIYSAFSGGIRDFLIDKDMNIPSNIKSMTPMPLPGHPLKLRNYLTGAITKLPTGEADPIMRLDASYNDYERVRRSPEPVFFKWLARFGGTLCRFESKGLGTNRFFTVGLSNLPAGSEYFSFGGHRCIDASFCAGLQFGITGLGCCGLSYGDNYRITILADMSVMTDDELRSLCLSISKNIELLYQSTIVDDVIVHSV